jgi:hypothetical protein
MELTARTRLQAEPAMSPAKSPEVRTLAWMALMGAESVAYHEQNVADRADDHAGAALAYYGSRGETPLVWGGSGAHLLGVDGEATPEAYRAVFGPGGARLPRTGAKLATTRRPGLELVVSPDKSVAELGVLGRADDMHTIVDAERDATLAYLDAMVRKIGGRRGDSVRFTPTSGLTWATSRHATTRAGDPQVHDHVLVANVVWMGDERLAGRRSTPPSCATSSTPPPPSAGWPRRGWPWSLATPSRPTPAARVAWAAGASPASPRGPWRCTRSARPRSTTWSASTPRPAPAPSPPTKTATPNATSRWPTYCDVAGPS